MNKSLIKTTRGPKLDSHRVNTKPRPQKYIPDVKRWACIGGRESREAVIIPTARTGVWS